PAEPAAAPVDMPDWLQEAAAAELAEPAEQPVPVETPIQESAVDDISKLAEEPPETVPTDMPDWLGDLERQATAPPDSAVPSSDETSDWLSSMLAPEPEGLAAEETEATAEPSAEMANVLDELFAEEPEVPSGEASESGEPSLDELAGVPSSPLEKTTGELLDIDFSDTPISVGGGEDLLGLTSDFLPPTPEEEAEVTWEVEAVEEAELVPGTIPDWLQSVQPEGVEASPIPTGPPKAAPDLLDHMESLRFEAIVGEEAPPASGEPETVGALKDVVGVIHPEMVFEGGSLTTSDLTGEVTITDTQSRNIERLRQLLEMEKEEVVISEQGRMALPLARWLVTLVMVVAIAVPVIMDFEILPAPQETPRAVDAEVLLAGLSDDATVLMAFEYEPESAAELEPLAAVLLKHLADKSNRTIYAVSTKPIGPAMADDVFRQVFPQEDESSDSSVTGESGMASQESEESIPAKQEEMWINLGFIPGGANGVSELVLGSPEGVPSRLSYNSKGLSTGIVQHSLKEHSPALIVVVSARPEDLRPWVEQAGPMLGAPILAATSASSAPLAQPYKRSGQVAALLIGVSDTLGYQSLEGGEPDASLITFWNAQAVGGLVAALAIILGGVFYGLTSWRKQEQDR
ncbi:MAG: hypothetical protein JXB30_10845, partial [Anaerolineae bacterium]|nr:hypothetical protein [Anaerolineae bacterium]